MANKTVEKTNPDTFLKEMNEVCCTKVTEEDLKDAIEDEYRVMYSRDGKKLLKASFSFRKKKYVVREGTEVICDDAFRQCGSLQSITIPNSVTSIGDFAFYLCESLQSITIPNSVTSIGDYAFFSCESLQSVTIPNSVTSIGDFAFCRCESLQSVTIPNSVTSIGDNAFWLCKSLQSVTIPNSVTSIGDNAFESCESLQSVTIPNSVTKIGNHAFRGCNICFFICNSPYFQNDDVCLFNKDKTAIVSRIKDCVNYIIPNSVTSIGNRAFWLCKSLQSITIPNSVTSIGDEAFCLCGHLDVPSRLRLKELNYKQN